MADGPSSGLISLGTGFYSGTMPSTAGNVVNLVGNPNNLTNYWGFDTIPFAGYIYMMWGHVVCSSSTAVTTIGFSIGGVGDKLTPTVTGSNYFKLTATPGAAGAVGNGSFNLNQNIYGILKSNTASVTINMYVNFLARLNNV